MDPRDFLDLAKKLSGGSTAAEYRTAISRAYYATYHVGAAFLKDIGCPISAGPQAHGEVRNDLSNCGDAELAGVGSQLADLHKKRNWGIHLTKQPTTYSMLMYGRISQDPRGIRGHVSNRRGLSRLSLSNSMAKRILLPALWG